MASHKSKKRKGNDGAARTSETQPKDTSKPSAVFKPTKGRDFTLSIALPGSIIANALTHDQKTILAGQIARACAVFCVDEVIIFDDGQAQIRPPEKDGYTAFADPNFFLYHILSYLETPPHLRKRLFAIHPDLRTAGSLPSLDMPHHLRSDEDSPYREGIVDKTIVNDDGVSGSVIECGLQQPVFVPLELERDTRVTLKLVPQEAEDGEWPRQGEAISPEAPREEAGYYWGYSVRQASSLSNIFTECPYDGGYDISIGTSERGTAITPLLDRNSASCVKPIWKHFLLVFGGVAGLEPALAIDHELASAGVKNVSEVFEHWINLLPGQGSRTIRTEEAIWIGLTSFKPLVAMRSSM